MSRLHKLTKLGIKILLAALVVAIVKALLQPSTRMGFVVAEVIQNIQFYLGLIGVGTVLFGIWRTPVSQPVEKSDISDFERFLAEDPANGFMPRSDQQKAFENWRGKNS